MKIRLGFVSNSSSSSFVIAFKQDRNPCPTCGRTDPIFLDLFDDGMAKSESTCLIARGLEYVIKEYLDDYYHAPEYPNEFFSREDITESREQRKEIEKKIREEAKDYNDDEIAYIEISYHDEAINRLYSSLKKTGSIKEILSNG